MGLRKYIFDSGFFFHIIKVLIGVFMGIFLGPPFFWFKKGNYDWLQMILLTDSKCGSRVLADILCFAPLFMRLFYNNVIIIMHFFSLCMCGGQGWFVHEIKRRIVIIQIPLFLVREEFNPEDDFCSVRKSVVVIGHFWLFL